MTILEFIIEFYYIFIIIYVIGLLLTLFSSEEISVSDLAFDKRLAKGVFWPIIMCWSFIIIILWGLHVLLAITLVFFGIPYNKSETYKEIDKWFLNIS